MPDDRQLTLATDRLIKRQPLYRRLQPYTVERDKFNLKDITINLSIS